MPRGIVARPMRWDEIVPLVQDGTVASLGRLGRLQQDVMAYRAYRKKVWANSMPTLVSRCWRCDTSVCRHSPSL
jgi:hypothetical protein